jgi:ATP-dependent DNA ligase
MPTGIRPQLARAASEPPTGLSWVHEIKHDGHRVIAYVDRGNVRLRTRNGNDATQRFTPLAAMIKQLSARQAIIDGEVAVPDAIGVTNISLLDDALASGSLQRLVYYAFDLLSLDGRDLRSRPLADRKLSLSKLLADPPPRMLYSEHLACDGRVLFDKVGELGCEGIVSKRVDAPYTSGPSKTWLKCKHSAVGTFPVIGYVSDADRIESLVVAEPSPSQRRSRARYATAKFASTASRRGVLQSMDEYWLIDYAHG